MGFYQKRTHYLAVLFGAILIVLLVLTFVTFAFGTYAVFNHPNSDVVAKTIKTSSGAIIEIQGTDFALNATRNVWIDPQLKNINGTTWFVARTGVNLGIVSTDSGGNIIANVSVSSSQLNNIASDGQSPHALWVMGNASVSGSGPNALINATFDTQQNYTAASTGAGIYFFVTLFVFSLPVNFTFGQLFIVLWTIYLILFAIALNGPFRNIVGAIKDTASRGLSGLFSNSAFAMFAIFPIVLWGSVLLSEFQQSFGVPTGQLPPADPLLEFVELALAPLREEIGFRVIPIGVVALVILFSRNRVKDGLLALWHPSRYLKKNDTIGEYRNHQIIMYILIGISAALFGAAHVLLGAGWDIGKVTQAGAAGVALGVLYYQYGFAATVLLHWAIDYALDAYTTNAMFANLFTGYELFTIAAAVASTIALSILLYRKLKRSSAPSVPAVF